jgi:hypothetical protein
MSILDVNLSDIPEIQHLADNTEAMLRIKRVEVTPQKNYPNRNNLALVLDAPETPLADDIRVWIPIPSAEQKAEDQKAYAKTANRFKEFISAFRVEMPLEVSDLLGKEAWAIVSEEVGQNGLPQNSVRRFIARK